MMPAASMSSQRTYSETEKRMRVSVCDGLPVISSWCSATDGGGRRPNAQGAVVCEDGRLAHRDRGGKRSFLAPPPPPRSLTHARDDTRDAGRLSSLLSAVGVQLSVLCDLRPATC